MRPPTHSNTHGRPRGDAARGHARRRAGHAAAGTDRGARRGRDYARTPARARPRPTAAARPVGTPARVADLDPVADVRSSPSRARATGHCSRTWPAPRAPEARCAAVLRAAGRRGARARRAGPNDRARRGRRVRALGHAGGAIAYVVPRARTAGRRTLTRRRGAGARGAAAQPARRQHAHRGRRDAPARRCRRRACGKARARVPGERAHAPRPSRDGDAWLVAWTGGVSADDEVVGTVRAARVCPRRLLRNRARAASCATGRGADRVRRSGGRLRSRWSRAGPIARTPSWSGRASAVAHARTSRRPRSRNKTLGRDREPAAPGAEAGRADRAPGRGDRVRAARHRSAPRSTRRHRVAADRGPRARHRRGCRRRPRGRRAPRWSHLARRRGAVSASLRAAARRGGERHTSGGARAPVAPKRGRRGTTAAEAARAAAAVAGSEQRVGSAPSAGQCSERRCGLERAAAASAGCERDARAGGRRRARRRQRPALRRTRSRAGAWCTARSPRPAARPRSRCSPPRRARTRWPSWRARRGPPWIFAQRRARGAGRSCSSIARAAASHAAQPEVPWPRRRGAPREPGARSPRARTTRAWRATTTPWPRGPEQPRGREHGRADAAALFAVGGRVLGARPARGAPRGTASSARRQRTGARSAKASVAAPAPAAAAAPGAPPPPATH